MVFKYLNNLLIFESRTTLSVSHIFPFLENKEKCKHAEDILEIFNFYILFKLSKCIGH